MARLTHLTAKAQRRLWRLLVLAWGVGLLAAWAVLSALTRVAEKAYEDAGQTYVMVAPMAAEAMDLRGRMMTLGDAPPLQAAEQVAQIMQDSSLKRISLTLPNIMVPPK